MTASATPRTEPDSTPGPDLIAAIVRRHRALGVEIATLADERDGLKARFAAAVPVGYVVDVDGKPATKSAPSRQFSLEAAENIAASAGLAIPKKTVTDADDLRHSLIALGRLDEAMLPGTGAPRVTL